jgi:MFS family permease
MSFSFILILSLFTFTNLKAIQMLLSLYALNLGAQPFAIGILAATYAVLPMLLSWQAGRLADRFGSRWPLMIGALSGSCGILLPYYLPGLPAIYVAAVTSGLMLAVSAVSYQNLVGLLSNPRNRSQHFGTYSLLASFTGFLGPLLSGFSIDHMGHAAACLSLSLVSLVPLIMLTIWGRALPRGTRSAPPKGSVRELLTGSGLWRVLVTSSLMTTGVDLFMFYMPIYGHGIGLTASVIGIVLAMNSVAGFIVRLVLPTLIARLTEEKVLAYAFFLGAASLTMVPFFTNPIMLMFFSFWFGMGMGCGMPITMMLTFSNSADGRSGEALGLRMTVNHLTRVIVPVVFGSIGSLFGFFPVFLVNALMIASGGFFTKPGTIGRKRPAR